MKARVILRTLHDWILSGSRLGDPHEIDAYALENDKTLAGVHGVQMTRRELQKN